jgi:hypothetical protein
MAQLAQLTTPMIAAAIAAHNARRIDDRAALR